MILKVNDLIELNGNEKYSDLKTNFKIIHPRIGDVTLSKYIGEMYFFFDFNRMRHMKKANLNDHVFVHPKNKHADKKLKEFLSQKEENIDDYEKLKEMYEDIMHVKIKGSIFNLNHEEKGSDETMADQTGNKGEIFSLNKEKITFNADEYDVETKENGQIVLTPKLPKGEFSAEKLNVSHLGKDFWVKVRYGDALGESCVFHIINEHNGIAGTYFPAAKQIIKTAD